MSQYHNHLKKLVCLNKNNSVVINEAKRTFCCFFNIHIHTAMKIRNIRLLTCIMSFVVSLSIQAQDAAKIDSLLILLQQSSSDTVKIKLYISLHREYANSDSVKSMTYINKAVSLSNKLDNKDWISRSNLELSHYYLTKGLLEKARNYLLEVKNELPYSKDRNIESAYFGKLGLAYFHEGKYDSAANNFLKAKNLYEILQDSAGIGQCYMNLGSVYWRMNDLDNALDNYERTLDFKNSSNNSVVIKALGNIGLIYRARKNYDKALDYYKQSLELCQKHNFKLNAAINLQNIGVGREKALELQQKSVWKSKSLGLKITEERLRLLSNELQKQLINITDLKDALGQALGTRVMVNIPNN